MIANPLNNYLPGLESVSYPPKKINTVAVKVTRENIGALSIEFEAELLYDTDTDDPFFFAELERVVNGETTSSTMEIQPGDWIVVLWDQYRVFRDTEFSNTFRLNAVPAHELALDSLERGVIAYRDDAAHTPKERELSAERRDFSAQHGTVHDDPEFSPVTP